MDHLASIFDQIETKIEKSCRLKQLYLFVQYNYPNQDHYLSFQSGCLHVLGGDRFTGKTEFMRYIIDNGFCEAYPVEFKVTSPFPKHTRLKQALQSLHDKESHSNSVIIHYEDIGRIPKSQLNSIQFIHYHIKYCKLFSQELVNSTCFFYHFRKIETTPIKSTFKISIIHVQDRETLITNLNQNKVYGTFLATLRMEVGKQVIISKF